MKRRWAGILTYGTSEVDASGWCVLAPDAVEHCVPYRYGIPGIDCVLYTAVLLCIAKRKP